MASGNMNEAITRIETAVDSQSELLAQLSTILDGKAAGGSGGASVETCSVVINASGGTGIVYNTVDTNGNRILVSYCTANPTFTINCVKNDYILIGLSAHLAAQYYPSSTCTGGVKQTDTTRPANSCGVEFYVTDDGTITYSS